MQTTNQATTNLVNQITTPGYIQQAVGAMNLQEIQRFSDVINGMTRNDQLVNAIPGYLVPQLNQLQAQRDEIDRCITALNSAATFAFSEEYYQSNGYQTDPFYDLVANHLDTLTNQNQQAQIQAQVQQQVQQQMAQLQAQQAASSSASMQEG